MTYSNSKKKKSVGKSMQIMQVGHSVVQSQEISLTTSSVLSHFMSSVTILFVSSVTFL